jgi:hypothetical protein
MYMDTPVDSGRLQAASRPDDTHAESERRRAAMHRRIIEARRAARMTAESGPPEPGRATRDHEPPAAVGSR